MCDKNQVLVHSTASRFIWTASIAVILVTRIITFVSGKGGAGKTTLTAGVGTALAKMGKNVVVLDANITTPNLGFHLGMPLTPVTLHDVLKGTARIRDAVYEHDTGLKVVPAGISLRDMKGIDPKQLPNALLDLLGTADIIILDAAAGLGREALASIEAADEIVLITNPDITSVTDALKAAKLAQQMGTRISGIVINRATKKRHEMNTRDIVAMLGEHPILSTVPEDVNVRRALAKRMPVVQTDPNSPASREIKKLAAWIAGESYYSKSPWYRRIFGR
jgi:septum site-determining protein MinD